MQVFRAAQGKRAPALALTPSTLGWLQPPGRQEAAANCLVLNHRECLWGRFCAVHHAPPFCSWTIMTLEVPSDVFSLCPPNSTHL